MEGLRRVKEKSTATVKLEPKTKVERRLSLGGGRENISRSRYSNGVRVSLLCPIRGINFSELN